MSASEEADHGGTGRTKNMSIAICLLLSWKLLMYALETLFVASESTPSLFLSADGWGLWKLRLDPTGQRPFSAPGITGVQRPSASVDL